MFRFLLPGDENLQVDAERAAATDKPLCILGAPGTGKAALAEHVHNLSKRRGGPFRRFSCSGIPPEMAANELFGYSRKTPAGGTTGGESALQAASGGTLYLDDFGAATGLHAPLLNLLQSGEFRSEGPNRVQPPNVRLMFGAEADARDKIGRALWARITEWPPLNLLPLRVQRRKKWVFFRHFVESAVAVSGAEVPVSMDFLLYFFVVGHEWPRNAGQLKLFAEYLVEAGMLRKGTLELDDEFGFFDGSDPLPSAGERMEDAARPGQRRFRNAVHRDFAGVVRSLQLFGGAHTWRDLSKASPAHTGRWEYPLIRWTDPHFDSQETCARMGQEYGAALLRLREKEVQGAGVWSSYSPDEIPWNSRPGARPVVDGQSGDQLAKLVAFGLLTGGISDRERFLCDVYAEIVHLAPNRSQKEYQAMGIPRARLKELLG